MAYYTQDELDMMGFKYIGKNVKLSDKASVYDVESLEIGDNSRIDDFCVISGKIKIGRNVYVGPFCLLAGGEKGLVLEDFVTLSYRVMVFTQSDDYSGKTMSNPTIPKKYKEERKEKVVIKKHSMVGAGASILPGCILAEGTSVGAMSLVLKKTESWFIYIGIPAIKLKRRMTGLLELEKQYIEEMGAN